MNTTDSQRLLADYVAEHSEVAFRELVTHYIDFVYSVAARLTEYDSQLAQDVTQTVFVDLARTAPNLNKNVMLGGWLHRHTCFVTAKAMRSERRRKFYERWAVEMSALHDDSQEHLKLLAPVLDEAINQLCVKDRTAIVLRFFEQCDFSSIGNVLGVTDDAAQKRVTRALEKLRGLLQRRRVALSVTTLATVLTSSAVTAAPASLSATVSTAAFSTATTSVISTATVLAALNLMIMTKTKLTVIGALVACLVTTFVVTHKPLWGKRPQTVQAESPVPKTNFPRSSWAFVGFADPASTFETSMWAARQNDGPTMFASLTPEVQQQFRTQLARGRQQVSPEQFLSRIGNKQISGITGYRIVDTEILSDNEVRLHLDVEGKGAEAFRMRKVGDEWKIDNIAISFQGQQGEKLSNFR